MHGVSPSSSALQMRAGGSDYYFLHDHLYSPAVLIGYESGQWRPVERYEYDAYGTARVINRGPDNAWFTADDVVTGSSAINTTLFTGRTLDSVNLTRNRSSGAFPEDPRFTVFASGAGFPRLSGRHRPPRH
jgi:hypothetical protein